MKKFFIYSIMLVIIVGVIGFLLIIGVKTKDKYFTQEVYGILEENTLQQKENKTTENETAENEAKKEKTIKESIQEQEIVGVIKIPKINFEGCIYDGTTMEVLKKGVGHFKNSPFFDGNVCLAAHNSNKYWAKLHTLQKGDKIVYISLYGKRDYEVSNIVKIEDTDWSYLNNKKENVLTLITCVKGEPNNRLCVQANEIL